MQINDIEARVSEPYYHASQFSGGTPYTSWFLSWQNNGDRVVEIRQFKGQDRFIISRTYPVLAADTFEEIIQRAVTEKYTLCT